MTEARSTGSAEGSSLFARAVARYNQFFFTEEPVFAAVYFRVALALWTVAFFAPRLPHLRELYTERAIHVPHPWMARLGGMPELPLWAVWLCVFVLLLSLTAFATGYHARKLHPLIFVLLCYLFGYDVSTVRGYGQLAFYQWLVAYCLPYDRLRDPRGAVLRAPRWGLRLAMMLFTSVYLFGVLAKMHGGEGWFDGKTLYYTLHGHDYGRFLLSAWFPVSLGVARVLGWATLASECFIGLGLWIRASRPWAVLVCVVMHGTMALSLRVSILFHLLMLVHLPLFLSARGWEGLWQEVPKARPFSALRRIQS
jgi:hypothetical protein